MDGARAGQLTEIAIVHPRADLPDAGRRRGMLRLSGGSALPASALVARHLGRTA